MFELSNASSKYFLSGNFQTFVGFVCKHIPGSACCWYRQSTLFWESLRKCVGKPVMD